VSRLVFVDRVEEAAPAAAGDTVVVLDATYTPRPGIANAPLPIRPVIRSIVEEVDVIDGSLAVLDAWAAAAGLADAFEVDDVTWWYRARMLIRWDAHELVLWRHVLDRLEAGRYAALAIPSGRSQLVAAARAITGRSGPVSDGPQVELIRPRPPAQRFVRRNRRRLQELMERLRPAARVDPARTALLQGRLEELAGDPGSALALAWPRAFQVVREGSEERRVDPYLVGALDRLAAGGVRVTTVGLGLDHAEDADWELIRGDARLLPEGFLNDRQQAVNGDAKVPEALDAAIERSAGIPAPLDGVDLAPQLAGLVRAYGGRWFARQRGAFLAAEATLRALRPAVLLTNREASRTAWLAAARRAGVPSVAIQHGMIYPGSPEYFQAPHRGRVRPDVTCVFGEAERQLLVTGAGFGPDEVVVTGSPRPLPGSGAARDEVRAEVRRELGVAEDDRLLLVSVAHNEVLGELHTFATLERLLGAPLPRMHVVIKLHPQDRAEPRHDALLAGIAEAGGHAPPALSIVRDMDLYRLLGAADGHLGQFSTVLSDAVVAGTPNMIAVGQAYADALGYVDAGVATPVRSVEDVRAFMADPQVPSAAARQRFLDEHFLPGDAAGRLAAVLRDAMRRAPATGAAHEEAGNEAEPPSAAPLASGSAG
jgi:hypothetical protein